MKDKHYKKGFTIIEVILVLAIASLIFAVILITFPILVRTQHDAQRRTNLALIVTAMNDWNTTHRFTVDDAYSAARKDKRRGFCKFFNDYVVKDNIFDPSTGEHYKVALWGSTRVIDCTTGKEYDRGKLDPYAVGTKQGTGWPVIEVGEIQYDDTAICSGETFNDHVGKRAGLKFFAFRTRLESGGYLCLDSATTLSVKE